MSGVITTKIPKIYRRILYTVLSVAWLSGITFFIFNNWIMIEGEFGPMKHPLQFTVLQIHGIVAFLMIIAFGYLLATHVQYSWRVKPRRKVGIFLICLHGAIIFSAYLLYYIEHELAREYISYLHLAMGFSYPFILILHIKRQKNKKVILA